MNGYAAAVRQFYDIYRPIARKYGLRMSSHTSIYDDDIRMKVLMTMRQKNQTTLQVEEWLKTQSGHDCFATAIRRSIIAEKSTVAQVPLPKFSKNCIVTQDYRAATYELMKEV